MSNDIKKPDIPSEVRRSIWSKWAQNLKDWNWYVHEHPDWLDLDIQSAVKSRLISPSRDTLKHWKTLRSEHRQRRKPETESTVGQLLLFLWGSIPRILSTVREKLRLRRRNAIHTGGKRLHFFESLHMNPVVFMGSAVVVALLAVVLSLYTLGTSAVYDGVELATVSSRAEVNSAVDYVETVTRQALSNENYTVDSDLLRMSTRMVRRTDVDGAAVLKENLSDEIGLVEYGYALYVDDRLVAATTLEGALDDMLEQLQLGYRTESTVECGFVENVEIREGFVDSNYMMNLGEIAEILHAKREGEVTYTVQSGDSLYGIAEDHGIAVSTLEALNPGYSSRGLYPGDTLIISNAVAYLTVKNIERQTYVQDIPFEIVYENDDTMYQGDYRVISYGQYGKADITANVTFVNGMETERQVVATSTLSDPVAEVQATGTIPRPSWYPTGSFRWPTYGIITDYFGWRESPTYGASSNHNALDIAASYGTSIYAADGGIVTYAGWWGSYGLTVEIEHPGTGFITRYAHCSSLDVSVGDHVYKGEYIAAMGSTGVSTGPHCHFEMKRYGTYVDPLNYLP